MNLFSTLRRLALPLLLGVALSACSKPADQIVGEWVYDQESLKNDPDFKKMEKADQERSLKMAVLLHSMSFVFTKDGKIQSKMGTSSQKGTYVVRGVEGKTITLATTIKADKKSRTEDLRIELTDKNTMTLTGPDGRSIHFKRK